MVLNQKTQGISGINLVIDHLKRHLQVVLLLTVVSMNDSSGQWVTKLTIIILRYLKGFR